MEFPFILNCSGAPVLEGIGGPGWRQFVKRPAGNAVKTIDIIGVFPLRLRLSLQTQTHSLQTIQKGIFCGVFAKFPWDDCGIIFLESVLTAV